MAINSVRLSIDGNEYPISRVFHDFDQPTNPNTGIPNGATKLSRLTISIFVQCDDDLKSFYEWQCDKNSKPDIEVKYYDDGELKKSDKYGGTYLNSIESSISASSMEGGVTKALTLFLTPTDATVEGVYFKLNNKEKS